MQLTGEYLIAAPRARVWAALNDPEVLKDCIPGCETLERTSETGFAAKVRAKVGPVSAKFAGTVTLSDLNPPESYTISGEGKGGAAGFAKGGAKVHLTEDGDATLLAYEIDAQVGGKLAQIGSRLISGTAKKLADDFFGKLAETLTLSTEAPSEAPEKTEAPPVPAEEEPALEEPAEAAGRGLPPGVWVTALLVAALLVATIVLLS